MEKEVDIEKNEKQKPQVDTSGMLEGKTLEDVIEREAVEGSGDPSKLSPSRILGGVIVMRFFQKHITLVVIIGFFMIAYITSRYMCQQTLIEINRVQKEIKEAHYKATICTSKLTEQSRESNVMKRLSEYGDSTLSIPLEPPYLIDDLKEKK